MEHLLNDMLHNPNGPSVEHFEQRLNGAEGQREFLRLLEDGNRMAFTYMKMKCKEWVENPNRVMMIHNSRETLFSLIFTSSEPNFVSLCSFFETLYLYNSAWDKLVLTLCAKPTERSMRVLNHMFNKYRVSSRSDALYTEIILNIELTKEIFRRAYFESLSDDKDILGMFYSLVYQDIHPFFEENADKFFNAFCTLFRKEELQQDICDIFNLFVLKYPECVDITRVLGALLTNISGFEYSKYLVLLNIVKRKNFPALMKFSTALSNAIRIGAYIGAAEMEEMRGDVLVYSRNLLKGYDVNRGLVAEMIGHVRKVLGDEWASELVNTEVTGAMDEERLIFLCVASRLRVEEVVRRCIDIVRNSSVAGYLSVISFRYLLCLNEYVEIDLGYLERNNPASFLAMAYLTRYINVSVPLDSLSLYSSLDGKYFSGSEEAGGVKYHMEIMNRLMGFLKGNIEDEFSSQLMQRVVRIDTRVITPETVGFISEFTESNIRNINSPQAYSHLFDVQGIIFLNTGENGFILRLVQTVLSEEIFEIYSSALFLLATVVLYSSGSFSSVVEIIGQESLWKTREMLPSMVCLTMSLFKTGYCSKEQVDYIAGYLSDVNEHCSYLLVNSAAGGDSYTRWIEGKDNTEEILVLATTLQQKGLMGTSVYEDIYSRSVMYFEENFISRRNARRVLRSLVFGAEKTGRETEVSRIVEKNKQSIGHEGLPFSVIVAFKL